MSELRLENENGTKTICLKSFDHDSELEIELNDEPIWLNVNQVIWTIKLKLTFKSE